MIIISYQTADCFYKIFANLYCLIKFLGYLSETDENIQKDHRNGNSVKDGIVFRYNSSCCIILRPVQTAYDKSCKKAMVKMIFS